MSLMPLSHRTRRLRLGNLGGTPSVDKQALNATINAQSLLQTPEQFRDITLRVNQDGSEVRLGDVATVEMGGGRRNTIILAASMVSQPPGWGVKLASGANEMATAELVLNRLDELAQYFPHGLEYKVAYETTSFVKASIEDVVKTLLEAIAPGFPRYVSVPAKLPRHADTHYRRAGGVDGNLLRTLRLRLQRQHLNHVRDGAGDRSAGG